MTREDAISTIKKLIALHKNEGATSAERESARVQAQRLITKFKVLEVELQEPKQPEQPPAAAPPIPPIHEAAKMVFAHVDAAHELLGNLETLLARLGLRR